MGDPFASEDNYKPEFDDSRRLLKRNGGFDRVNRSNGCVEKVTQSGNNGKPPGTVDLIDEYARGTLRILIEFDPVTGRDHSDFGEIVGPLGRHITFHESPNSAIRVQNSEGRMRCRAEDRGQHVVLILIIELVELVEVVTYPKRKGFRGLDGVLRPLTGYFYAIARGFEADPVLACGKSEMAILCAAEPPRDLPDHVIKGRPKIVNSVAYYKGKRARDFFAKHYSDGHKAGLRIELQAEHVRFSCNEDMKLPFKFSNVMIGPVDFLFRTAKHTDRSLGLVGAVQDSEKRVGNP